MKNAFKVVTWTTGIAIFSMFFGAGNVIFPIVLGQQAGDQLFASLTGLMITAIGGPLLGLFAAVLFEGDTKQFFCRIGTVPGYVLITLLLILIGPFGAMPRCITVSYAAMQIYFPALSLFSFSVLSGIVMLLCIVKRDMVLSILGNVLSPILLISLFAIIIMGLFNQHTILLPSEFELGEALINGLEVGYGTMDLLASIFFSAAIWNLLRESLNIKTEQQKQFSLVPICLWASVIGGISLGIIYIGLSFVAAINSPDLIGIEPQQMLSHLVVLVLGEKLAIIANVAIALACLTTVISLGVTIADVIHNELDGILDGCDFKFNYYITITIIVIITVLISNLGFETLMKYIVPVISICYPAIIVLTICNIVHKLYGVDYVKMPFYGCLLATVLYKVIT